MGMFVMVGAGSRPPAPILLEDAMQIRTDKDRTKARLAAKAWRRDLRFRVRRRPKRGEWRYRVVRNDGLIVWGADCLSEIEYYLDKATPREWRD